jgi:hypothetical protein
MVVNIGKMKDVELVKTSDKDLFLTNKKDNSYGYQDEQKLEEVNNIKEVLINLDKDEVQQDNLTTIDFNTRLGQTEISSIVALQLLHTMKVGGRVCSLITRSIKRHKVSLGGLGRKEKVQIIQGEREHEEGGNNSLFGKIKGFMGNNKNETN